MQDRSPGSHATGAFQLPPSLPRTIPSDSGLKSHAPTLEKGGVVHTVAGQRRIHTCFPCIQHEIV